MDILAGLGEIKICVAYDIDGQRVTEMPASLSKFRNAKPIYETLPGWSDMTADEVLTMTKDGYDSLPQTIKNYIEFIEKEVQCRVTIISIGPGREQTIIRE